MERWLMHLSTMKKLMFSFGLVIAGFALLLGMTQKGLTQLEASNQALAEQHYPLLLDIREIRTNVNAIRAAMLTLIAGGQINNPEALEADVRRRNEWNETTLSRLQGLSHENQELEAALTEMHTLWQSFGRTNETEVWPQIRKGEVAAVRAIITGMQAERSERFRELGRRVDDIYEQQIETMRAEERAFLNQQRQLTLVAGAVLVGLTVYLAWLLTRLLAQPMRQLTGWAEQISRGEVPDEIPFTARRDEVGQLGAAFVRMGQYLRRLVGVADNVRRGELDGDVQPVSERDVLGSAFVGMVTNLRKLADNANRVARGELTVAVTPTSDRDLLTTAFTVMVNNLRQLTSDLHEGVAVLATASEEIMTSINQTATSTQETATAISEIATTVEEVKQTAVMAGGRAKTVSASAERTRQVAQEGREAVDETLQGMNQIREQMQAIGESIMRLGEQTQTIGEIVATVNDLAEQSNLLGVNASIEAVKAGDAGKGFVVVAQEVKALAEQSKKATAQVRAILSDVQKAMTKAVLVAEQGSKTVESGYQRAQVSGEAIRSLSGNATESSEMAMQIAATSQQQMVGMDQVAVAMENIRVASQDNVSGIRQVEQAARNLHQLGGRLKQTAAQFKL